MVSTLIVRPAAPGDLPHLVDLLVQLGYPVRREALTGVLDALLGDARYAVLVAEHPGDGVVAMIALSSRPVLRLQGWLGTIEELVVKRGMRDRGIGDRMVQHAKGLATERGWMRLETSVARTRESSRRGFLLSRGFAADECVTYHWACSRDDSRLLGCRSRAPKWSSRSRERGDGAPGDLTGTWGTRWPGARAAPGSRPPGRPRAAHFTQHLRGRHRAVTCRGDTSAMTTRAMGEAHAAMATRRRTSETAPPESRKSGRRVLVVEDEQDVAELMRYNLAKEGYDVTLVGNGADALKRARQSKPDVILLDIMVPQLNGWEVCRRLKQDPETRGIPVIMVTGRVEEGDKVLGFEMGADDYVTKPFSPRELVARIRAVVRRGKGSDVADRKQHLKAGDLEIDRHRFEVIMKGQRVDLTPKEFDLLAALMDTPGRVFGREELLDLVWGADGFVEPRTVDVHVARLRAKFTAARLPVPGIETVRGVGYRFREQDPARLGSRN